MRQHIKKNEPEYPNRLVKLSDPPAALNVWGRIPIIDYVAIVGTRQADVRMIRFTRHIATQLAARGIGVLSGGALGIDAAAHQGALDVDGVTVAVIGSGLDYLHPKSNGKIFAEMVRRGGVVSEFADKQPAFRWTFPRRNRIVAAMASAVVVMQAPMKSGALITARLAGEMGVPVGAVPFEPGTASGMGGNQLIKNGARMIETVDDIVALMKCDVFQEQLCLGRREPVGMKTSPTPEKTPASLLDLPVAQKRLFDVLSMEPMAIDAIISVVDASAHVVLATLMEMELLGLVEDVGGKRFVRCG